MEPVNYFRKPEVCKITWAYAHELFHGREPWINIIVFRWFTIPLTIFFVNYTRVTPNQVTLLSCFFGIMSAAFFYFSNPSAGAFFYIVSYLLDAVDGKIARAKKQSSNYGAFLDFTVDRTILISVTTAICYNNFMHKGDQIFLLLNAIFLSTFLLGDVTSAKLKSKIVENTGKIENDRETTLGKIISRYDNWSARRGLDKNPIGLVEITVWLFCVAPFFDLIVLTLYFFIILLILRLFCHQIQYFRNVQ